MDAAAPSPLKTLLPVIKMLAFAAARTIRVSPRQIAEAGLTVSPDCRKCAFHETIPGDAHLACRNHAATVLVDGHGYRNGWASWPFSADPLWIRGCSGFSETDDHSRPTGGLPFPVIVDLVADPPTKEGRP